ncbi:hypothetical protein PEC106568_06820 [Pectobacterium carotovorum subsp. carotovorum]|nr:hypothetical protein PEC106568_06820 [Pectobacterium carotovorum subsp. carotovorum]
MSEIKPNDLPPINELDEFTSHIPELQIDTDVLAGPDGPANFQAKALANRTKYLKRILDAVSLELDGLGNAATHNVQTSATDATAGRVLKLASNGQGSFGIGGAVNNPITQRGQLFSYSAQATALSEIGLNRIGGGFQSGYNTNRRAQLFISNDGAVFTRFSALETVTDNTTPWRVQWDDVNMPLNSLNALRGGLSTTNLNTLVGLASCGLWSQTSNGAATLDRNYPVSQAGLLTIESSGANNVNSCMQIYKPYNSISKYYRIYNGTVWTNWFPDWSAGNLPNPATLDTAQIFTGAKTFQRDNDTLIVRPSTETGPYYLMGRGLDNTNLFYIGKPSALNKTAAFHSYAGNCGIRLLENGNVEVYGNGNFSFNGNRVLISGVNAVADSSGFWKTASPVINIYSDGSFTTTDEAAGVNVERLSEGVYKITGCHGMHPDAAWNGIDGGVSNPKCRNDKALLWNNYEVAEDGSITVYTFHRVHPEAMPFAQNRLTLDKTPFDPKKGHTPDMEWPDQSPIDVPRGLFIQVRVNMPEREEPKPTVMASNVYCNSVSPAK